MLAALLTTLATALLCLVLEAMPRWAWLARHAAVLGIGGALGLALVGEGLEGPVLGAEIAWPGVLDWLSEPIFRSDALGAGLGFWCLLAGGLSVARMVSNGTTPTQIALALFTSATLYALTHTSNLLAFAALTFLLVGLVWAYHVARPTLDGEMGATWQLLALGLGAAMLLGAVALIGRASGGVYDVLGLPLPALSVWPLLLLAGFVLLWLGSVPFAGWSAGSSDGAFSALVQALVLGVPVVVLLLRLQALYAAQSLAGAIPQGWVAFMGVVGWLGALTALAGAAGTLVRAGTLRFFGGLTALWLGLMLWAISLDTPLGRYAAVALLLSWGAGRIAWELSGATLDRPVWGALPRGIEGMALACAPLSMGFAGAWLLGSALAEKGPPALSLVVVGAALLGACGVVLHIALSPTAPPLPRDSGQYSYWASVGLAVALAAGGVLPGLWLPLAGSVAGVAGGTVAASVSWTGVQLASGGELPMLLLTVGVLALAGLGWLTVWLARRGAHRAGALLPAALDHLHETEGQSVRIEQAAIAPLLRNPPAPVYWLSLGWVEDALLLVGRALSRPILRAGSVLGRLEGRYYLPIALVLTLVFLLAVTR